MAGGEKANGWSLLVLAVAIIVYAVYFAGAWYTYEHLPPIPVEVRTSDGRVLFTGDDVVEGKWINQRYGLQDYGSVLGFGGYFGMDYTAYAARLISEEAAHYGLQGAGGEAPSGDLVKVEKTSGGVVFVVDDSIARAYERYKQFLRDFMADKYGENRLADGILTSDQIDKVASFYMWTALIALEGYTNGFPYTPGLIEYDVHPIRATWVTIFVLLLVIMPLAGFIIIKFIDYWRDERITVSLPAPGRPQRLALLGMGLAMLGLSIQGLLGGYMMHLYAESEMYGVDLSNILPFNVARGLHYNLAILWIAVTWVSFALFTLPYFGVKLSEGRSLAILGAGAAVSLGALLGLWASYLGKVPDGLWFLVGSQGRPVVSAATLWLLLVSGLLAYLALVVYRASKANPYPFNSLLRILAIGLGGTAFGAFVGALPVVRPFRNFTLDEYFRWITIHAFVEGFWPAIVVPILLILLVIAGMVPPRLAVAVAGLDASLEIASGMIGTAHHYYWGGEPTFWMYVGAAMSTLEVLPIGFLIAYAIVLWRRGEVKTELQKTLLTFVLVAALGGAIGVVAFGAGLINMPIINYYLHGSQATMVHAHLAMPLAYGVPSMLMWVVAFYLSGAIGDRHLGLARKAAVVIAAGFYLQVILSLGVLMYHQFQQEVELGYWAIKGPVTPDGQPGIWASLTGAIWARMIGDLVAAGGIAALAIPMLLGLPRGLRGR
ncbi:MAG: nitric-oxide reductase large subunit [Desulfurococcales archaeon]|nr:nitric-oxide reductase large subunit [Desulfurococcales archaeon]